MATQRLKNVEQVVSAALPSTAYVITSSGTGSGFCVGPKLFITNFHVINDAAQDSIKVRCNERLFNARVLGTAEEVDLALLSCNSTAPMLSLQAKVSLGEACVAIGSPGGLINTVTRGVVSGLARATYGPDGRLFEHVLQTDAVINPGNSGGPLLNLRGEVIGMPFLGGAMQGINYAVSAEMIKFVIPHLRKRTSLQRARIGVSLLEDFSATGSQFVRIVRTADEEGGLVKGDIVTKFNGSKVNRRIDIWYELCALFGTASAKAEVLRNGRRRTISVKLDSTNTN
jgi:S1-C subfamily serine protease